MAFIPAKCTQCGANIEVDDTKEAGICKFCGTAYVTEKAITNYNTYIKNDFNGANINIISHGNPDYQCPKCQSEDIKALKLIEPRPTYKSYKNESHICYIISAFFSFFLLMAIANFKSDGIAALLIFLILTVGSFMAGRGFNIMHNESYKKGVEDNNFWKHGFKCMRCGERFLLNIKHNAEVHK